MDQQQIIADLEGRAKAVGLTIGDACRQAGLHPTTFSRWKLSDRNPNPVSATMTSIARVEAVIADAERAARCDHEAVDTSGRDASETGNAGEVSAQTERAA